MVEQIDMTAVRKQFDFLRLVGRSMDASTHFYRDYLVLFSMENENRRRHRADVALVVVLVRDQQAEWQPKVSRPGHIDRRRERRFQHDRGHRPRCRKPYRLARPQRLAVDDGLLRENTTLGQVIVGGDRVSDIVLLCRTPARTAIASVVKVEDAKTVLLHRFDSGGAIGSVGPVAMEIENRRLSFLRWRMPGDQRGAIGSRDFDLLDAVQASRRRSDAGRIRKVHELAVAEIDRYADHGVDHHKPEDQSHDFLPEAPGPRRGHARGNSSPPTAPAFDKDGLSSQRRCGCVIQNSSPLSRIPLNDRERHTVCDALRAHVEALAVDIGPRTPFADDSLERAATYIRSVLLDAGYSVTEQPYKYLDLRVANIIGTSAVAAGTPDSYVVGAHYDTVPTTPGADDNASAVAVMLELARRVSNAGLKVPIQFVAFTLEEPPAHLTRHQGSRVFVRQSRESGHRVLGALILEMVGYTSPRQHYPFIRRWPGYPATGEFIGIIGNWRSRRFGTAVLRGFHNNMHLPVESLFVPLDGWILPSTRLSDHASFWDAGWPALMITDTAFFRNPTTTSPATPSTRWTLPSWRSWS